MLHFFQHIYDKLWFIYELPFFIHKNNFVSGVELGAKAGRSMRYVLAKNPQLERYTGIDLWEVIPGKAYADNPKNYERCRKKLERFGSRVSLHKGDAFVIADNIADDSLDFIFYDLYNFRVSNYAFHEKMFSKWMGKLKIGGLLIGRDFHHSEIQHLIQNMGYQAQPCYIRKKHSAKLKYIQRK